MFKPHTSPAPRDLSGPPQHCWSCEHIRAQSLVTHPEGTHRAQPELFQALARARYCTCKAHDDDSIRKFSPLLLLLPPSVLAPKHCPTCSLPHPAANDVTITHHLPTDLLLQLFMQLPGATMQQGSVQPCTRPQLLLPGPGLERQREGREWMVLAAGLSLHVTTCPPSRALWKEHILHAPDNYYNKFWFH